MSTSKDNFSSKGQDSKARLAQKQTSTLLFDNDLDHLRPDDSSKEQDIAAVSLSIDSLSTKIPVLTPTSPSSIDNNGGDQNLKNSQLHYLESNKALTLQAIQDAETASDLLKEAKATQITLLKSLKENEEASSESKNTLNELEAGLEKCNKILRESRFIQQEIEKLYLKTEKQQSLQPSGHNGEVTRLIAVLQEAQSALETTQAETTETLGTSKKTLEELQTELEACHKSRLAFESKAEPEETDITESQKQLKSLTGDALNLIKSSEDSLSISKTGQTSYIALSREISAIQKELTTHKRNAIHLSLDLQSANKAIALNKVAVECLTNDLVNFKQDIQVTKESPVLETVESIAEKNEILQLVDEAQSTHKRINQLLQLNNTVSDRITKADQVIYGNAEKQTVIAGEQEEALRDIREQRQACKRLIDQANRSHTLIVSACKKTSLLAEAIEDTTQEERKHRKAILSALKDNRTQKKTMQSLQASLEKTHEKQLDSLTQLEESHNALKNDEIECRAILDELKAKTNEVSILTPELQQQKIQVHALVELLNHSLEDNNKASTELLTLQNNITENLTHHKLEQESLQDTIKAHLESYQARTESLDNQQHRLESLEKDFSAHIANIEGLSTNIQEKLVTLSDEQLANNTTSKDLEFSKTELRYLKEQCDQLLKECIDQSRVSKKNEDLISKSIALLEQMETSVGQSIQKQKSQEQGLDQLNTLVNTALNDLNNKLEQMQQMQGKTQEQSQNTLTLQSHLKKTESKQQKTQDEVALATKTIQKHIDIASTLKLNIDKTEAKVSQQVQKQSGIIEKQSEKLESQNQILTQQTALLSQVEETHDKTQKSLATIEEIRKKAQQSFAHLGTQKTKFEKAFTQSLEKLRTQDEQQARQQVLLQATETTILKLETSSQRADDFEKWRADVSEDISKKLQQIDEYQSRAFQAQQSAQAREEQLENQYQNFQTHLTHLEKMMQSLDTTRLEEAQYRDELRALVHHHERQQKEVDHQLSESQERHDTLTRSLEDAHLMFRENKIATKETQMANRETKLILQEIRKEISQLKQSGLQTSQTQEQWESEERIELLESQLSKPLINENEANPDQDARTQPYQPSSFML